MSTPIKGASTSDSTNIHQIQDDYPELKDHQALIEGLLRRAAEHAQDITNLSDISLAEFQPLSTSITGTTIHDLNIGDIPVEVLHSNIDSSFNALKSELSTLPQRSSKGTPSSLMGSQHHQQYNSQGTSSSYTYTPQPEQYTANHQGTTHTLPSHSTSPSIPTIDSVTYSQHAQRQMPRTPHETPIPTQPSTRTPTPLPFTTSSTSKIQSQSQPLRGGSGTREPSYHPRPPPPAPTPTPVLSSHSHTTSSPLTSSTLSSSQQQQQQPHHHSQQYQYRQPLPQPLPMVSSRGVDVAVLQVTVDRLKSENQHYRNEIQQLQDTVQGYKDLSNSHTKLVADLRHHYITSLDKVKETATLEIGAIQEKLREYVQYINHLQVLNTQLTQELESRRADDYEQRAIDSIQDSLHQVSGYPHLLHQLQQCQYEKEQLEKQVYDLKKQLLMHRNRSYEYGMRPPISSSTAPAASLPGSTPTPMAAAAVGGRDPAPRAASTHGAPHQQLYHHVQYQSPIDIDPSSALSQRSATTATTAAAQRPPRSFSPTASPSFHAQATPAAVSALDHDLGLMSPPTASSTAYHQRTHTSASSSAQSHIHNPHAMIQQLEEKLQKERKERVLSNSTFLSRIAYLESKLIENGIDFDPSSQ